MTEHPGVEPVAGRETREARPRRRLVAAAALVVVAAAAGAVVLVAASTDRQEGSLPAERERAVLSAPHLSRAGSLPDQPVQSVQDFPVPFTFSTPPRAPDAPEWTYALFEAFDLGNGVGGGGLTVLAPTETYDPTVTWQGQTQLVPAPTDAAGWAAWLEQTGHVDVTDRRELLVGGAPATRFTLDLHDLPEGYDCGGARRCVALAPMRNPHAGPSEVGSGAQTGIEDGTREMTVIELEDRAVVALLTGRATSVDEWLPALRAVVDSLRFA